MKIQSKQKCGDKVMFDDYTPSQYPRLVQAIDEICKEYQYDQQKVNASNDRGYLIANKT